MVMRQASELRIGELAARSGLTPDALRYYEQVHRMLGLKLADLETKLVQLQEFRRTLRGYLRSASAR